MSSTTLPSEVHLLNEGAGPVGAGGTADLAAWHGQPYWGQQAGEGMSTEKGQLRMEIPLVFSHGQQGLFKEYIQLKIDFSV